MRAVSSQKSGILPAADLAGLALGARLGRGGAAGLFRGFVLTPLTGLRRLRPCLRRPYASSIAASLGVMPCGPRGIGRPRRSARLTAARYLPACLRDAPVTR